MNQLFMRMVPVTESTSLKNESGYEDSSFPVSTSLKNESVGQRIVPVTESTSLKNELGLRTVLFLCQPR